MPDERKEKVIHTRIPAALEDQIKRLAEGLRVPVSNLVRNMLEDALAMTRRFGRPGTEPGDTVPEAAPPATSAPATDLESPGPDLSSIYGWQALTLNLDTTCARCQQGLEAGDDAYVGLTDQQTPRGRTFICPDCVPKRGGNKNKGRTPPRSRK